MPSSNSSSIALPSFPSDAKILKELQEIREKIAEYEEILASDKKLRSVIVKELEDVRDRYGDARRTQIIDESAVELQPEDLNR